RCSTRCAPTTCMPRSSCCRHWAMDSMRSSWRWNPGCCIGRARPRCGAPMNDEAIEPLRRAAAGDRAPAVVSFHAVAKSFDAGTERLAAIGRVDLEVRRGGFVAIVGPSGCGKSTLLQISAGLQAASSGEVRLNGAPVTSPPEGMVYLFQQYSRSLMPWLTAAENV